MMFSLGSFATISFSTVSPPMPESNMPIAFCMIIIDPLNREGAKSATLKTKRFSLFQSLRQVFLCVPCVFEVKKILRLHQIHPFRERPRQIHVSGERLRLSAVQEDPDLPDLLEILHERINYRVDGEKLFRRRRLHVFPLNRGEIDIYRARSIDIELFQLHISEHGSHGSALVRKEGRNRLLRLRLRIGLPLDGNHSGYQHAVKGIVERHRKRLIETNKLHTWRAALGFRGTGLSRSAHPRPKIDPRRRPGSKKKNDRRSEEHT